MQRDQLRRLELWTVTIKCLGGGEAYELDICQGSNGILLYVNTYFSMKRILSMKEYSQV